MGAVGTFQAYTYATININHPVKEIIVKQIAWVDNQSSAPGQYDIGVLFGDIVNGGCLGTFNANNASISIPHYTGYQNVRHVYKVPKNISGSYQFTIQDLLGLPFKDTATRTIAQAAVIMEFISYDGTVTDVST